MASSDKFIRRSNQTNFVHTLSMAYIILVVTLFLPLISAHLEKDLRLLSRLVPGIYSNREQFLNDATLPSDKRHSSMQAIFRPVDIAFFHGTFNVYVEKYTNYAKTPFKQWLYVFETDHDGLAIKMKIYDFVNKNTKQKLLKNAKYIKSVKEHDVVSNEDCDMTWRRLSKKSFHGTTGRNCLANMKGEQIRMEITAELTSTGLNWQEGWYRVSDGTTVKATNGPYMMKKIKKIKGKRYQPRIIKQVKTLERKHIMKTRKIQNQSRRLPRRRIAPRVVSRKKLDKKMLSDKAVDNRKETVKILSSYEMLRNSLLQGQRVHYTADVSKCSVVGAYFAKRPWFGDYIEIFDIKGNMQGDANMIRFSHTKFLREGTEFLEVMREIKVYTDGTTVIDLYVIDPITNSVKQQSMAVCKLFDYTKRRGSVRFSTHVRPDVVKMKSYKSLMNNLQEGRSVRVSLDISSCSGQRGELQILGCEIRDYDFLNNGSTIQVSFERKSTDPDSENIIKVQHQTLTFTSDNVAQLWISNHDMKNVQNFKLHTVQEKRYRCNIGPNWSTQSVHMNVV